MKNHFKLQRATVSFKLFIYSLFITVTCLLNHSCNYNEETNEFELFMQNNTGVWKTADASFTLEYGYMLTVIDNGISSTGTLNTMQLMEGNIEFSMSEVMGDRKYHFKVNKMVSKSEMEVTVTCFKREDGNFTEMYRKDMTLYKN